jgi:hypothetical protein
MQHDTLDILFSLFKMTFNLKGSVHQEFSFIVKIKKKSFFVTNSNKINIFCFSSRRKLMTRHFTPEAENVEIYDVAKKILFDGRH